MHAKACASLKVDAAAHVLKSGRSVVALGDSVRLSKYPNRATLELAQSKAPPASAAEGACGLVWYISLASAKSAEQMRAFAGCLMQLGSCVRAMWLDAAGCFCLAFAAGCV